MTLPVALARWEYELTGLPRDVALALGPWLGRLEVAIGPWADARRLGDGEPDGVGTIARRGAYERLLASEWLLAEEVPDEFLRCAASSEHLFLSTVRRAPAVRRRCVVLFDAGPSQLGAPRLSHVALMIVLARRAHQAGARFEWGVLQHTPALREGCDVSAIQALLDRRTTTEPTTAFVERWSAELEAGEAAEAWAVSGAHRRADLEGFGFRAIAIEDPVEIDRNALRVQIARRTLELPLPDERIAARLIRSQWRPAAPKLVNMRAPRTGAFGLPGDGRKLLVETADGFLAWPVPNSPRATPGSPRRFVLGPNERLLAAGHRGRRLLAVAADGDDLVIYGGFEGPPDPRGRKRFVLHDCFATAPDLPAKEPEIERRLSEQRQSRRDELGCALWANGHSWANDLSPQLVWQSRDERLSSLSANQAQPRVTWGVLAFCAMVNGRTRFVQAPGARTGLISSTGIEHLEHHEPDRAATRAFFGGFEGQALAYTTGEPPGRWRVLSDPSSSPMDLSDLSGEVIGVHAGPSEPVSLVLLDPDRRTVSLVSRSSSARVLTASAPIERALSAPRGNMVAWRTVEGWIEVGSLTYREVLLRIAPEEAG